MKQNISNTAMAEVHKLIYSKSYSNPEDKCRAYDAMKQVLKQTTKVCKAESVKELFQTLNYKGIILNAVGSASKNLIKYKLRH